MNRISSPAKVDETPVITKGRNLTTMSPHLMY